VGDADVTRYMKLFTMMTDDEIAVYDKSTDNKNGLHRLAYEMTLLVHGKDECERAVQATNALFPSTPNGDQAYHFADLQRNDIISAFAGVPQLHLSHHDFMNQNIISIAVKCTACSSKAEARRLIIAGGIYLNNQRVQDSNYKLSMNNLMSGICVLRVGKSRQHLIVLDE
jgi:tyrosyl-tRNA synthetase